MTVSADFYEDDEPPEKILHAYNEGETFVTGTDWVPRQVWGKFVDGELHVLEDGSWFNHGRVIPRRPAEPIQ